MNKLGKIELSFLIGFIIVCICMFCIDYLLHLDSSIYAQRSVAEKNEHQELIVEKQQDSLRAIQVE